MELVEQLEAVDRELAETHGAYASYTREDEPPGEFQGPSVADEMDRLLSSYATPDSSVLDLGCGAGFTLCRLAPTVTSVWGFEQEETLLQAARLRVMVKGIRNASFVLGNNSHPEDIDQLPDDTFDLGFSQRGPNLTPYLLPKLKSNAVWVQEFAQLPLGLNEVFGRNPRIFQAHSMSGGDWEVNMYQGLEMLPISVRTVWFEQYFQDMSQLDAYLGRNWCLIEDDYRPEPDRGALELYCRYNMTPKGIRLTHVRKIGVYRRRQSE